ncbi:cytochrome P450 [Hyaloscypha variabilis F]|uniref:Cytochrome P450 n=1 Tax=Hyaloscypha variabilis (strain UAMH 11265 / GT02V1 / F) TaxID=1149755 RepID=A0A2J6S1H4_HYAVF|nr:cytochrome P450 [Hyaloscypha variabilis F]
MTESSTFPLTGLNSLVWLALIGTVSLCLCLCHRWALSSPIPGIPYNKEAAESLLGDVIPMIQHIRRTQEVASWWTLQTVKLRSPIIQLFIRPFGKPFVFISDFREAQDILLRRTKEFDRSTLFSDVFSGIVPNHHAIMKTTDVFKQQRRWLQDLMTHDFLQKVAAPRVYASFEDLMKLWAEKSRLAEGHPFAPSQDVNRAALDAVWGVMFAADPSNNATRAQFQYFASIKALDLPSDVDKEVQIPQGPDPVIFKAITALVMSVGLTAKVPLPALAHWLLRQFPYMRKLKAVKDEFLKGEVEKSLQRFAGTMGDDIQVNCGTDEVLRREKLLSENEGRAPLYHSKGMYDELFGFIVAAHETTATTITWTLKMLTDYQDVQEKLRSTLHSSFVTPKSENRPPTHQEIVKSVIPYLDAVIEEAIRYSRTSTTVIRTTATDVQVLGATIPKDTEVFLLSQGPSIFSPAFPIPDSLRSKSALAAKDRIGSWDPKDIGDFKPERWLKEENGKVVFDAASGPMLTFGLGPRGCFGRRLAYLEMRLVVVLLVLGV